MLQSKKFSVASKQAMGSIGVGCIKYYNIVFEVGERTLFMSFSSPARLKISRGYRYEARPFQLLVGFWTE